MDFRNFFIPYVFDVKESVFPSYAEQLRCSAYWVCFDDRTIWVFCDFFTPKRFEPRLSFFSMSKYRNSRRDSKNFKFFPLQVFQIFDSKHGSPENYSDFFFFMLNNYVVQHIWVCFDDRTIWVFCDFFTSKRFEPRPSFFSMSKYRNSRPDSRNFKFFSPPVFQIIDSKHGSPEDYSDFFFCYAEQLRCSAYCTRFGALTTWVFYDFFYS